LRPSPAATPPEHEAHRGLFITRPRAPAVKPQDYLPRTSFLGPLSHTIS
jgi:hypothetical protein